MVKDLVGVMGACRLLCYVVSRHPYILVDGQNFVACDYIDTPTRIHPEWYFLFAYAILRSVPNKVGGILLILFSILILLLVPEFWLGQLESLTHYLFCQYLFWFWVCNFCLLTFVGRQGVEEPFIRAGELGTIFYFVFFPLVGAVQAFEDYLIN